MKTIELQANGKPLIFTGQSASYEGQEYLYNKISEVAHRGGEQPAFVFTYDNADRVSLPYDPKDKDVTMKIFRQVAVLEKKRNEEASTVPEPPKEEIVKPEEEVKFVNTDVQAPTYEPVKGTPNQVSKKPFYKKIWLWIIIAVLIIAAGIWFIQVRIPYNSAVKEFDVAAEQVSEKNEALDKAITAGQKAIKSKETPLDMSIRKDLNAEIANAEKAKRTVLDAPRRTADVIAATKTLNEPLDYSAQIASLEKETKALQDSFKQFEQLTNPSGGLVIKRLKTIDTITDIQAVTEDNDPNEKLNKAGGYTSCVYFSNSLVGSGKVSGKDVVEKGTDGGGAIEVYKTASEAKKRNTYLSAFDGNGFMDSGSHRVVGTVLIRTSRYLTASQQKKLEKQIYNALIKL